VLVLEDASEDDTVKADAVLSLETFACNDKGAAVVAAGAIPPLVEPQLRGCSYNVRAGAAGELLSLTLGINPNAAAAWIAAEGAILWLVELLSGGLKQGRENAVGALGLIASNDDANRAAVVRAGAIPPLVELLSGGSD
jgi:hypothetical protein